jgi:hypothetical protein
VVVMLLAGTGVSVYEYLESTQPLERHPAHAGFSPLREVQAAERGPCVRPAPSASPVPHPEPSEQRWSGYPSVGSSPAAGAADPAGAPAFWEPSEERLGS